MFVRGEVMLLLAWYYALMIGCYFLASKLRDKKENLEGMANNGLTAMMYFIVFIMGIRMGSNEQISEPSGSKLF